MYARYTRKKEVVSGPIFLLVYNTNGSVNTVLLKYMAPVQRKETEKTECGMDGN